MKRRVLSASLSLLLAAIACQAQGGRQGPTPGVRRPAGPSYSESRREFQTALSSFRESITKYREALGFEVPTDKLIKDVEKPTGALMDFIESAGVKTPKIDFSEFSDLSIKEIEWETLTTAERADNNLRIVGTVLDQSQRENSITIQALEFMREVQGDLVRLRWLIDRMEDLRSQAPRR
jgi:hypothetical protein